MSLKRIGLSIVFVSALTIFSYAQNTASQNQDFMHSEGKLYVVLAVVLTILIGLFVYLFSLGKKLGRIENQLEQDK